MAKRFADTRLSREKWFRILTPAMKGALRFLLDDCDEAGVWSIDEAAIEFNVGVPVSIPALIEAVNADGKVRLELLGRDKVYIPGFVPFQYGKLSESCKPHKKAIARLRDLNLWERYLETLRYPLQRVQEEEEDKEEEEEKEKGGVGENKTPAAPPLADSAKRCAEVWLKTLESKKQSRKLIPGEDVEIARAIKRWDAESVELALIGIRHETGSATPGGFDPAQHVSLNRVLDPGRFARFVGLGAAEAQKRRRQLGDMPADQRAQESAAAGVEEIEPLSEEQIQSALGRWSNRHKKAGGA